jgi:hypothetical protein
MSDNINDEPTAPSTDDILGETPLQKALRVKKATLEAREKPPRGGRFQREQAARVATGASRPWMKN